MYPILDLDLLKKVIRWFGENDEFLITKNTFRCNTGQLLISVNFYTYDHQVHL